MARDWGRRCCRANPASTPRTRPRRQRKRAPAATQRGRCGVPWRARLGRETARGTHAARSHGSARRAAVSREHAASDHQQRQQQRLRPPPRRTRGRNREGVAARTRSHDTAVPRRARPVRSSLPTRLPHPGLDFAPVLRVTVDLREALDRPDRRPATSLRSSVRRNKARAAGLSRRAVRSRSRPATRAPCSRAVGNATGAVRDAG